MIAETLQPNILNVCHILENLDIDPDYLFSSLQLSDGVTRVEKFHGSLLSDPAQVWQCPDRLVWKFWAGSDLALVSIPWQKSWYMWRTKFFLHVSKNS